MQAIGVDQIYDCSRPLQCKSPTQHYMLIQVRDLTEDMAALEAENGRLTEVINAEQPHNEELLLHVKELQHVRN